MVLGPQQALPQLTGFAEPLSPPSLATLPAHLCLAWSPGEGAWFSPKSLVFSSSQTCWKILLAARGAAFLSRCPRGAAGCVQKGPSTWALRALQGP